VCDGFFERIWTGICFREMCYSNVLAHKGVTSFSGGKRALTSPFKHTPIRPQRKSRLTERFDELAEDTDTQATSDVTSDEPLLGSLASATPPPIPANIELRPAQVRRLCYLTHIWPKPSKLGCVMVSQYNPLL
jgi:hypothetical protein